MGSLSCAVGERQSRRFAGRAVPPGSARRHSPSVPNTLWAEHNPQSRLSAVAPSARAALGSWLVWGHEQGFLEQTGHPPTSGKELLEGTDPGNPQCCDLPPPAARAINVCQEQHILQGPFRWS